jgi:hypothetical protein
MFHGPWLQVPVEQLAHVVRANLQHPRPHPYDPAVLQDALRVRRAVDDATDLAVRAASGLVSAPFSSRGGRHALGSRGGGPGEPDSANETFGFGGGGGGGHGGGGAPARLSRERQFRMRDMAAQKLAAAYRCDEIAASVATMQSASSLDDVAAHVLRRNAQDLDALYVHFFHEKIPSREVARCTPLGVLDRLVLERPNDPAAYRTRALTKMFKDDHEGAVEDLTRGLSMCRLFGPLHDKMDAKEDDVDPQRGIEPQMLFHRANCYLHLATRHVKDCLDLWRTLRDMDKSWELKMEVEKMVDDSNKTAGREPAMDEAAKQKWAEEEERYKTERKFAVQYHLDMRKVIKTNARKAIRDYMGYLSFYDYFPGQPESSERPEVDKIKIYKLSDVFASSPLEALAGERSSSPPPHPPPSPPSPEPAAQPLSARRMQAQAKSQARQVPVEETVSFHPLQPEALCALLLAHTLAQTPDAELRRHAGNAARLVRTLSGSPVFSAGAPAAGVDWAGVLVATGNVIKVVRPWRALVGGTGARRHARVWDEDEGDEEGAMRWQDRLIEYEAARETAREAARGAKKPGGGAAAERVGKWWANKRPAIGESKSTAPGLSETAQAHVALATALDGAVADRGEQGGAIKAMATAQSPVPPGFEKQLEFATVALQNMDVGPDILAAAAAAEAQGKESTTVYLASDMTDEMFNAGAAEAEAALAEREAEEAARGGRASLLVGEGAYGYGEDDRLYGMSTERSQLVARWVMEAPTVVPGEGKKGAAAKRRRAAARKGKGGIGVVEAEAEAEPEPEAAAEE